MIDIFNNNSYTDFSVDTTNQTSPQTNTQLNPQVQVDYKFNLGIAYFQSGKFDKALPYIEAALQESLDKKNAKQYLYCCTMLSQIYTEMSQKEDLEKLNQKFKIDSALLGIQKDSVAYITEATCLINMDILNKSDSNNNHILNLLTIAINEIFEKDKAEDLSQTEKIHVQICLMYCLITFSKYYLKSQEYEKSQKNLEDVETIISTYFNAIDQIIINKSKTDNVQKQIEYNNLLKYMKDRSEYVQLIKLHVKFMKAQLSINFEKNYKKAEMLLEECYEMIYKAGHHYLVPYVYINMANVHYSSNNRDQADLFLNLALKNIQPQHKFLSQYIDVFKKNTGLGNKSEDSFYDLVFNQEERSLIEKQKGYVNFKNQFILLEMLKMFILNKGETYSKKNIVENIWKQEYSPSTHDNKIYVTIKRLREMIEPDINMPKYICRNSQGYYLSSQAKILIKGVES